MERVNAGWANLKPIKKGEVRNPAGRPKGSRHKLETDFVNDVYTLWKAHGIEALTAMIADKPGDFCNMVARLLPKDLTIHQGESALERILASVPDEQLASFTEGLRLLTVASAGGETINQDEAGNELTGVH